MFASIRPYLPTATLAFLLFYFTFHALTGDRGVLAHAERERTLVQRSSELERLTAERRDLEIRAQLLRDDHLSADLLEERARALLGFADPRDYVIRVAY